MATEQEIAIATAAVDDLRSQIVDERVARHNAIVAAQAEARFAALKAEEDRLTKELEDERASTAAVVALGAAATVPAVVVIEKAPDGRELAPGQTFVEPPAPASSTPSSTSSPSSSNAPSAPSASAPAEVAASGSAIASSSAASPSA